METIKVIDLLNKIANGEEVPKKIKFDEQIYKYVNRTDELYNYKREDGKYFEEVWMLTNILNSEVEIIEDTPKEDKKIEHIDYLDFNEYSDENKPYCLLNKINEIIDKHNMLVDKVNGE